MKKLLLSVWLVLVSRPVKQLHLGWNISLSTLIGFSHLQNAVCWTTLVLNAERSSVPWLQLYCLFSWAVALPFSQHWGFVFPLCHVREIQLQHTQPNTQKMKFCGISTQSRSYSWTDGQNHNSPELGLRGSVLDHLPQWMYSVFWNIGIV